jgi:hypothetical protein
MLTLSITPDLAVCHTPLALSFPFSQKITSAPEVARW